MCPLGLCTMTIPLFPIKVLLAKTRGLPFVLLGGDESESRRRFHDFGAEHIAMQIPEDGFCRVSCTTCTSLARCRASPDGHQELVVTQQESGLVRHRQDPIELLVRVLADVLGRLGRHPGIRVLVRALFELDVLGSLTTFTSLMGSLSLYTPAPLSGSRTY